MTIQQGLVSLRGANPNASVGEVGVLQASGSQVTYTFVNPPPAPATESLANAFDRAIEVFSDPDASNFGVGAYSWVGNKIYDLSAAPTWTLDYTVTMYSGAGYSGHTGLTFIRSANGGRYLAGMAYAGTGGNNIVAVVRLDLNDRTTGWSQTNYTVTTSSGVPSSFTHALAFEGKLWACSEGDVFAWNPDSNTITSYPGYSVFGYARLCNVNQRLFWLGKSGSNLVIRERFGGAWIQMLSLGRLDSTNYQGYFGLFAVGGQIYTFHYEDDGAGNSGLRHYVTTVNSSEPLATLSTTEYTSPVIPAVGTQGTPGTPWPNTVADWRYRASGPTIPGCRVHCIVLNESPSGGVLSSVLVYFSFTATGNVDVFTYAGTANPMVQITPIGPGPTFRPSSNVEILDDTFPIGYTGGNENTISSAPRACIRDIVQETIGGNPEQIRIKFYVTAAATTTGLKVAFYWWDTSCTNKGPHCFSKCSLISGTVTGVDQFSTPATLDAVNDRVQAVTAEVGGPSPTVYTVGWDYDGDGGIPGKWGKLLVVFE